MSEEEDFAALFAASEKGAPRTKRPRVGDVVRGKVISIGKDAVFLDVGGKAEGTLDRAQVTDNEDKLTVKVGDTLEARVSSDAGGVLGLRIKVGGKGPEIRAELAQAAELGIPVEGTVTEVIKGGVSVDVAGVRGFCPASQIEARFVEDLTQYVGKKLEFRITRYEARNLVLSRRALVEEQNKVKAAETRKKLEIGVVIRGKVTGFKPFGAFVDIGGIEGMLHVSELGYARVEKPEDVLKLGQELDVAIVKLEGDRISLSLKALANDPWTDATAQLHEGSRVKGKITRLADFGAFVEVAPGVDGLVHISELGAVRRINHPKEIVSPGQEVEATVLAIDHEKRKLSLSLSAEREASATPAEVEAAAPKSSAGKLGTFGDLLTKAAAKKK